jgi:hypothetical protein
MKRHLSKSNQRGGIKLEKEVIGDVVLPSLPFPSLPSPPVLSSSFLTFIFSLFIYCLSLSPSALGHDKVTGAELFFS